MDQTGHRKRENAGQCHDEKHGSADHVCPIKRQAVTLAKKRRKQVKDARLFPAPPPPKERTTLGDALLRFLEESRVTKLTWEDDLRYAKVWGDAMGDVPMDEIKASDVEKWRRKRLVTPIKSRWGTSGPEAEAPSKTSRGKRRPAPADPASTPGPRLPAPATVNRHVAFLKRVFNVAIRDELCEKNPCKRVRQLRENNVRIRYLTDEEEKALRSAFPTDRWHIILVAFHTGLRQAEQFALRWDQVDFLSGEITIPRSKHGEACHIPMNDTVVDALRALPSRMCSEWVYPAPPVDGRHGRKQKVAIPHLTFASIRSAFERATEKAGIVDLNWHDLRRTFCSRLVMKGVDLRTVQDLMGHKCLTMILRYSHLSDGHRHEAIAKLNPVLPETSPKRPMSEDGSTETA